MSDRTPEPSELIYLAQPSYAPILIAAGIALIMIGGFGGWVWALIGLVAAIVGVREWFATADDEISRMRREQEIGTAVIPAVPVRKPE